MTRQNQFLDELAALLQKYKVDVSVETQVRSYYEEVTGINFYSYIPDQDIICVTLPSGIYHDNITSTIQSFKE